MKAIDLDALIPAWIELQRTPSDSSRYEELFWSYEVLYNLVAEYPQQAFDVILSILRADQSTSTYENLSAGPLEDLLVSHGVEMIERIEQEATNNPDFRRLLGGVWKRDMDDSIWKRVQRCWDRRGWDGNPE